MIEFSIILFAIGILLILAGWQLRELEFRRLWKDAGHDPEELS